MTSIQSKRKMTQDKLQESPFDDLMYRAGLTADGSFGDMDSYDQEAIMRFAELIVKECADYIKVYYPHSWYEAEYMQRHFGVK